MSSPGWRCEYSEANSISSEYGITLGYKKGADYICLENCISGSTVTIAEGKTFTDGTNTYDHSTPSDTLKALNNVILTPAGAHSVTIASIEHGSVSADRKAFEDETVSLNITPDADYIISSLTVTDSDNNPVSVTKNYTFTMPAKDVTITAEFQAVDFDMLINMINKLPAPQYVSFSNKSDIEYIRSVYDNLSEDSKANINSETLKKFTDAEEALAQYIVGNGTEADPWIISTWADLKATMLEGGFIKLGADVTDSDKNSSSFLKVDGGIFNSGALIIESVTITGNKANNGGGIYNTGALSVIDAEILRNTAERNGGGIYNNNIAEINRSEITGNSCLENGGGIYVGTSGTLNFGNDYNVVTGNKKDGSDNNVYLSQNSKIQAGNLSNTTLIGVTTENKPEGEISIILTTGGDTRNVLISGNFVSDDPQYSVADIDDNCNTEAALVLKNETLIGGLKYDDFVEWNYNTKLPTEVADPKTFYLAYDVSLNSTWEVPSGVVNLDLRGHKITLTSESANCAINVMDGSTLRVFDSVGGGAIVDGRGIEVSDGYANGFSIVSIEAGGQFDLYSGTIQGHKAGWGVSLQGNTSSFNMYGGTITGNRGMFGGGVCINAGSVFKMCGGSIEGNSAMCGGALFVNAGEFYLYDGTLKSITADN